MDADFGDGLLVEASARQGCWRRGPRFVNQAIVPIEAACPQTAFVSMKGMVFSRQIFKFSQVAGGIDIRKSCFDFFRLIPPTVALQQAFILEFFFEFLLDIEN